MKTYFLDIIPKFMRFSNRIDNFTVLTKQNWICVNEENDTSLKSIYIFRPNQELIISINGKVQKWKWEAIGVNILLIDTPNKSYALRPEFLDENKKIISLRVDGTNEFAFLVEEEIYNNNDLTSLDAVIDYLERNCTQFMKEEKEIEMQNDDGKMKKPYDPDWENNSNLCPACGEEGVKKLQKCPECGLNLDGEVFKILI